ncbi:AraC family transcriptional regulator [Leptospira adleri]|nr:AraC family transcriptional regulator [Leptospira adleri]
MDYRFLTISALLYIFIGLLRFRKACYELEFYRALLFISLGAILWSYSESSCTAESGPYCSILEFFFVYSSILAALVFFHFQRKLRSLKDESGLFSKWTLMDPLRIGVQTVFASAFVFTVWKIFAKKDLPNLISTVSFLICIYYILIFIDILFRFRKTRRETLNLLPFLTVILIVEAFEAIKQLQGFAENLTLTILDEYFVLISPIVLHEILPLEKRNFVRAEEFGNHLDLVSEELKIKGAPYPNRKSQMKYNLLNNLNLPAVDQKLKILFEEDKVYLDEDLRLPALAEEIGISVHHLSAFINEYLGLSFNRFVNSYRVQEAKRMLLEEPERTVLSIGMAVGFNSTSSFHRAFFTETGLTPKQFREDRFGSRLDMTSSALENFNLN